MGQVAAAVQNRCCKGSENQAGYRNGVIDLQQILRDQECFNSQQWYIKEDNKKLFFPEKFIFLYSSYKADHDDMNKHWEKLDIRQTIRHGIFQRENNKEVLAPKWKYLIRRGIPMPLMRTIILDIYKRTFTENEMEYNLALNIIFKDNIPSQLKTAPLLMDQEDKPIEEVVKFSVLSKQGFEALKRILWVLKEMYHQIDYNPMIIQIATLLLIFLKEEEVYCVLKLMIEDSTKILCESKQNDFTSEGERSLRWHFLMKKGDFMRCAKSFFETVSTKSKTFKQIIEHFQDIGFDYIDLFMDIMYSIFSGYVNFGIVIKIFAIYMNEGIKVYFRFMYALCRVIYKDILKVRDVSTMKSLIRKRGLNLRPKEIKEMINKAFSLRLGKVKQKLQRYSAPEEQTTDIKKVYYIPHIDQESNIIDQDQLEIIWGWLPQALKLSDGIQIWCTQKDGFSFEDLYKKCEQYSEKQMLLIIQSDNEAVFGVYCDQMLRNQQEGFGSSESFVFTLEPNQHVYYSKTQQDFYGYGSEDYFTFGRENVALKLDGTLAKGTSEPSSTYGSINLTGMKGKKQFDCIELELYTFE